MLLKNRKIRYLILAVAISLCVYTDSVAQHDFLEAKIEHTDTVFRDYRKIDLQFVFGLEHKIEKVTGEVWELENNGMLTLTQSLMYVKKGAQTYVPLASNWNTKTLSFDHANGHFELALDMALNPGFSDGFEDEGFNPSHVATLNYTIKEAAYLNGSTSTLEHRNGFLIELNIDATAADVHTDYRVFQADTDKTIMYAPLQKQRLVFKKVVFLVN